MGMTATAEGVETGEQLDRITSEGCTEMQGFLFSRPRPMPRSSGCWRRQCGADAAADVEAALVA